MYAIVETSGRQYRVAPGAIIRVNGLDAGVGSAVELDRVLLLSDGERLAIGAPHVAGAKVVASVVDEGRAKKIIVFKYKRKVRYRRKLGHRQPYTELKIEQIISPSRVSDSE